MLPESRCYEHKQGISILLQGFASYRLLCCLFSQKDDCRAGIIDARQQTYELQPRIVICGKELGQKIIAFTHPRRPLF